MKLSDFTSLRYSAGGHPLTRAFSQRLGAGLAFTAWKLKLSPSAVTIVGLAVFVLASAAYAAWPAGIGPTLACALLLQLGYALDCADGQLARATGATSAFGARLDVACDYARAVLLGLGTGAWAAAHGQPPAVVTGAVALFVGGSLLHIRVAALLRRHAGRQPLRIAASHQRLRWLLTLGIDTASVLLLLALLRETPRLLLAYLGLVGIAWLAVAAVLARARLPRD